MRITTQGKGLLHQRWLETTAQWAASHKAPNKSRPWSCSQLRPRFIFTEVFPTRDWVGFFPFPSKTKQHISSGLLVCNFLVRVSSTWSASVGTPQRKGWWGQRAETERASNQDEGEMGEGERRGKKRGGREEAFYFKNLTQKGCYWKQLFGLMSANA